ncbi:MAG: fumarylacetoacetate hydrolase family protein [Myxococcota bacterium]
MTALARFVDPNGRPRLGRVEDRTVTPLLGDLFGATVEDGAPLPLSAVFWLPPVVPSKIVGVRTDGALFLMTPNTVIGDGHPITIPPGCDAVNHHPGLAVIVGRTMRATAEDAVWDHLLGVTLANGIAAPQLAQQDGHDVRARSADTFCPLGPWVAPWDAFAVDDRAVRCHVDGTPRPEGRTALAVQQIAGVAAYVSTMMTVIPGDVLLVEIGAGGPLVAGQTVSVSIDGVGTLRNPVAEGRHE